MIHIRRWKMRWTLGVALWLCMLLVALLAGYVVSLLTVHQPAIAQIVLEGEINHDSADTVSGYLQSAVDDPDVAGIVLQIDSPGGSATDSERLYFEVLQARESKPVIAMIDGAGDSGAYYVASAAESIYATALADVGNVGVWQSAYRDPPPSPDLLVSGPYKLSGASEAQLLRQFELVRQRFLQAVLAQRGERLGANAKLLPRGEAYLGVQALELGLIDSIGTLHDAVERAAERAGVRHYRVRTLGGTKPSILPWLVLPTRPASNGQGGE